MRHLGCYDFHRLLGFGHDMDSIFKRNRFICNVTTVGLVHRHTISWIYSAGSCLYENRIGFITEQIYIAVLQSRIGWYGGRKRLLLAQNPQACRKYRVTGWRDVGNQVLIFDGWHVLLCTVNQPHLPVHAFNELLWRRGVHYHSWSDADTGADVQRSVVPGVSWRSSVRRKAWRRMPKAGKTSLYS